MDLQFTPGAERAIHRAATWSDCSDFSQISAQALLLGLLAESECRAAITLASKKIDTPVILDKWPYFAAAVPSERCHDDDRQAVELPQNGVDEPVPVERFSSDIRASLAATLELLVDLPAPLTLATEHLLLGLVAADHEAATWLRGLGLDPLALAKEIHQQYGISPDPLPVDDLEPIEIDPEDGSDEPPGVRSDDFEAPTADARRSNRSEPSGGLSRQERIRLLRVIDAAENRGREGLRAIEDYVRFVLDDPYLTSELKRLRHEMVSVLSVVSMEERLAARETLADVGTSLTTLSETQRPDATSVMTANFARIQEALRSLEEFGKVFDPKMSNGLKELRYVAYTLQRAVETTRSNAEILAGARLYVLIDGCESAKDFRRTVSALVTAGADLIQFRDKRLDERALLERTRVLREMTLSTRTLFIVNDRPDLAVLSRADGVHVGQEDLAVKDARTLVGPGVLVGVSTHSIEQARQAVMDGADYIGVGPTFPSETKQFNRFPGTKLLKAVASEIGLPAFAIGGINQDNLADVLSSGIRRIAVSGAVTGSKDPALAVKKLAAALSSSVV